MTAALFIGALVARADAAELFDGQAFYWGDLHSHTGASGDGGSSDLGSCSSGACGAFADFRSIAEANGLDFVAVVDHVNRSGSGAVDTATFDTTFHAVNALDDAPGGFVTIPGAELFFEAGGDDLGHRSLFLFGDSSTVAGLSYTDLVGSDPDTNQVTDCAAIDAWLTSLRATDPSATLIAHHPGVKKPMPTDWSCQEASWGPVVEGWSEHGSSMSADWPWEPPWSGYAAGSAVLAALDMGLRLGVVGGTDNHDSHPGQVCGLDTIRTEHWYSGALATVVLDEAAPFDRSAIHDAIEARATYLSTGPRLPVGVRYEDDAGTVWGMGEEADAFRKAPTVLTVTLRFPAENEGDVLEVRLEGPRGASWTATKTADGEYSAALPADEVPAYLVPHLIVDGTRWWAEGGCEDGYADPDRGGSEDGLEHIVLSPTWFGEPAGGDTGDTGDGPTDSGDSGPSDSGDSGTPDSGDSGGPHSGDSARDSDVGPRDSATTPPDRRCGCGTSAHTSSGSAGGIALGIALAFGAGRRRVAPYSSRINP